MRRIREQRLVLRFAIASLVAFVLVGAAGLVLTTALARNRAERTGVFHARYAADSVIGPAFEAVDLSVPVRGATYERVRQLVLDRVLSDGRVVRVKIWRPDGTIVFSDEPSLVGMRFPEQAAELEEVLGGATESGISDLAESENAFERDLADKLFFTYAPLRLEPGGPVVAVAEIYQDYAFIQADLDAMVRRVALILGVGLAALYAAVLPLAARASRELRRRNDRLNELLEREQQTVAELTDLARKKDDFVATASHELRTPLTSIVGSLATLRQPDLGGDPAIRAEFLDAAERQTRRLQRVIANLLSAADLERPDRPVTIELVDLGSVVTLAAHELDASSRVLIDVPSLRVATDRGRIAEVLSNLIENALKYSPDDEPVEVGASADDEGFRVWVTDRAWGSTPPTTGGSSSGSTRSIRARPAGTAGSASGSISRGC